MYHYKASVGFEIVWEFFDDVVDYHSPVFACVPGGFNDVLWLPVWWSWDVGRVCDDKIEAVVFYGVVQIALLDVDVFDSIDSRIVLRIGNGEWIDVGGVDFKGRLCQMQCNYPATGAEFEDDITGPWVDIVEE